VRASSVTELQQHRPQVPLHCSGRPTAPRVQMRRKRGDQRRVIQQRIHPRQLPGSRSAGLACNRRWVPGGMGNDGRVGVRLSLWPRALQLPRGRGARGAAPETARGLPSVKAAALTSVATYSLARTASSALTAGLSHLRGTRPVLRRRARSRPAYRAADHPVNHRHLPVRPIGIQRGPRLGQPEATCALPVASSG
jgi:hypothetical protein